MEARFLCTGDVHIGRSSSGFESETALGAFERLTELALTEQASGLLIAGDLFDGQAAQYAFRGQVSRLLGRFRERTSPIPVFATAGNHDCDALPTFANAYPGLVRVFGSEQWQEHEAAGVRIIGRSFPRANVPCMFDCFPPIEPGGPMIGLVHADVDAKSNYNPVALSSLIGRGICAWVLGHVHAPRIWEEHFVTYVGSPQALDAGEVGSHGCTWLTVSNRDVKFHEAPISSVRYETVEVTLGPREHIDDAIARTVVDLRRGTERVSLRVHLLCVDGAAPEIPDGSVPIGEDRYEIASVSSMASVDLEREAELTDAKGQAARLLLGLDGRGRGEWHRDALSLVASVREEMVRSRRDLKVDGREAFDCLKRPGADEAERAVRRALANILAATRG